VRPETYYYHPDHLGSTSWVTDQNARVHERVEYFPYGEVWRETRSDVGASPVKGQRFLFTGKELDEETGLVYFGARYYDPVRVRWASTDPALGGYFYGNGGLGGIQNPRNLAVYSYAHGSPAYLVDPDGESATVVGALVGGSISAGIALWRGEDPRHVAGAFVHGAIVGAAVGSIIDTGGASLGVMAAAGALGNASGGIVGRAIAGDQQTAGKILFDAAVGAGAVYAGAAVGKAASAVARGVRAGGAVRYGPMNQGPLPEAIANTFRSGSYTGTTLGKVTTLYRVHGGRASPLGGFWTRTPPAGSLQSRIDLALRPEWGNTATQVTRINVPAGTTIYEGAAAAQGGFVGGGNQVFIPRVDPSWVVP
jgi:RHS repeat-associated protein